LELSQLGVISRVHREYLTLIEQLVLLLHVGQVAHHASSAMPWGRAIHPDWVGVVHCQLEGIVGIRRGLSCEANKPLVSVEPTKLESSWWEKWEKERKYDVLSRIESS
jgi:hypothetical protein